MKIHSQMTKLFVAALVVCFAGTSFSQTTKEATKQEKQDDKKAETKSDAKKDEKVAEEKVAPISVVVSDGNIKFSAPGTWKKVQPKSNMIEVEMKVPHVKDDADDGRLTFMGASGSIKLNIERWHGQFKQPDGKATADVAKYTKSTIQGQTVHMVDISGTFGAGMARPFGPRKVTSKPNHRMLAAIVETQKHGKYFVKLTGPAATMKKNEKGFKSMIESLKIGKQK